MSLTVRRAPPSSLLSTLAHLKPVLGIDPADTSTDDELNRLLVAASDAITTECGRTSFGVATYVETIKGTGSQLLGVSQVPLLSIAQILQDQEVLRALDPTDPTVPAATDGYYIDSATDGAIYRAAGWGQTVALLSWGWQAYASRYILPGGTMAQRYTVTYTAGYFLPCQQLPALVDTVTGNDAFYDPTYPGDAPRLPGSLEQACLETIKAWWMANGRDPAVTSAQVDQNVKVTYGSTQCGSLPSVAMGLIRNYRRIA